jgi:hypothetical protein
LFLRHPILLDLPPAATNQGGKHEKKRPSRGGWESLAVRQQLHLLYLQAFDWKRKRVVGTFTQGFFICRVYTCP